MVPLLARLSGNPYKESPQQSWEVPDTAQPGQTAHYRNAKWRDLQGEYGRLTIPELFQSGLQQSRNLPCLGHRKVFQTEPKLAWANEYTWETFAQVDERRKAVGSAIEGLYRSEKLAAGPEFQTVGIWSVNRPDYVINHAELPIIFCSSNHLATLIANAANYPGLNMIISFDPLDAVVKAKQVADVKEMGIEVMELSDLEDEGRKNLLEPIPATLDQVATICYTSGTTDTPKGVVLTHRNLASGVLAYVHGLPILSSPNPVMFSYLPLAHIYGRCLELLAIAVGGCIGFYTGDPRNLISDMQVLKPHYFPAVPRVLNRIYAGAMASARAPGLKWMLFRYAVWSKLYTMRSTGYTKHWLWDALVFKKVQAIAGGRIECITSGSAPINRDVMDFLKIAFACQVLEGYGLTETCAVGLKHSIDDPDATGSVGGPATPNEFKLVDVPELGYLSMDKPRQRGELCIRGDNVFTGYYKDETATQQSLEPDGWFHTGDVAEIDDLGRFVIIDRVKNIMKLSQGEYVALEKVENIYSTCPGVAQIYVHGDSLQDSLIAIVVPDPVSLMHITAPVGYSFDPADAPAVSTATMEPQVNKAVLDAMTSHAKKAGLKGFETVKYIHLTMNQFTLENDTLTPTFKIKRKKAYALHKDTIDGMYTEKDLDTK